MPHNEKMSYPELLRYSAANIDWHKLGPEKQLELNNFLWEITLKAARVDFYTFVKLVAPILIPGFRTGKHIEMISGELQKLYTNIKTNNKQESKLQVFLPPESMKTVLCSHLFPAWVLGKHPKWRVIAVAHSGEHAAKELGSNAKRILQIPEYQEVFPKIRVSRESSGTGFWKTTKGGYYFSAGWQTQLPGKRANLIICDDVVSEHTKPSELKTINHNFSSGTESRLLTEHSGQLVVNTRWYLDDISGFLVDRDGGVTPDGHYEGGDSDRPWRIIKIPAILDQQAVDLLRGSNDNDDSRFFVGGSYWPEHKSVDDLLDAKRRCTPHQWNALYLQTPIPMEGSIFLLKHFMNWTKPTPPEVSNVIISMDTAFSEKETKDSAESCYQIWGIFPRKETTMDGTETIQGNMILLGQRKGHWSFPELKQMCISLQEEYAATLDFFLIEDRASGISLIQELQAIGIPVVPYLPDRDKITRAHSASAIIHSGRVYLNQNHLYAQEFLAEIMKFPSGGKDTTDAFTQAVLWMKNNWHIVPEDYTFYNDQEEKPAFQRRPKSYWDSVATRH